MRKRKKTKKEPGKLLRFSRVARPHPPPTDVLCFVCSANVTFFCTGDANEGHTREREREPQRKSFLSCVRRDGWLTDDEGVGSSHVRVEPSLLRMCRRLWPLLLVRWRFETRTTAARWALVPRRVFLLGALHCWRGAACALATSSSTTYRCCVDRRR